MLNSRQRRKLEAEKHNQKRLEEQQDLADYWKGREEWAKKYNHSALMAYLLTTAAVKKIEE